MEQWKSIPGYEGLYEASNTGKIRSAEGKTTVNARCTRVWKQRVLKIHYTKSSEKRKNAMVSLWKDGERKEFLVARLVGRTWCNGYSEGLTINHIDGNPLNNSADNLEWVSMEENIAHSYRIGLRKTAKPCSLRKQSGETVYFYSMSEASRYLGRKNNSYLSTAILHGTKIYSASGEEYGLV